MESRETATDELRRMLDERGVEWWQSANTLGCVFTRWYSPLFGDEVCAMENGEEGLVLFDHYLTPEQAIAATLGRGTCEYCKDGKFDGQTVMMSNHGWQRINFCPNCGRKVVDA